jgi:hypothetical protein
VALSVLAEMSHALWGLSQWGADGLTPSLLSEASTIHGVTAPWLCCAKKQVERLAHENTTR